MPSGTVYSSFSIAREDNQKIFEYQATLGKRELFVLFHFDTDPEHNAETAFEEVIQTLNHALKIVPENKTFDHFERTLKVVNALFENPTDVEDHIASSALNINAVIAILDNDTLHVAKTGSAEAYLIRRGNMVEITEGMDADQADDFFVNIATGDLQEHDKVIFSTKRVLRFTRRADFVTTFSAHDIAECLGELQSMLMKEDTGDIAVSGFSLEANEEERYTPRSDRSNVKKHANNAIHIAHQTFRRSAELAQNGWSWFQSRESRQKKQILWGITVAIVILLGGSLLFSSNQKSAQVTQMEQLFQSAKSSVAAAKNSQMFDPKASQASLADARSKLIQIARTGLFSSDVQALMAEIDQQEQAVDKITNVTNPKVLVDLSKKQKDISAIKLIFFNQSFYAVSATSLLGPIVDSNPDSYTSYPLDAGDTFISGDRFLDRNSIALLTHTGKIVEFKDNNFTFMETDDKSWRGGKELRTYSTRQFVYTLDPTNNAIWKYERTNKSYHAATNYNVDNVDIKDAVSMAIDGSLYVLKQTGEVKKFYSQKIQNFAIDGGPSIPLKNVDPNGKIFTGENLRSIYILDPGNERVLVYKKQTFEKTNRMSYDHQFVLKGQVLRDIFVDDAEQSLYIMTPQSVLKIDLRTQT